MKTSLTLVLLALPLPVVAQDRIRWTDGTATDPTRTRVTDFTAFQIKFTVRGGREEEASDRVATLEVERVRDAYRRGFTSRDPSQVLSSARLLLQDGDKFLAQFGFQRAAEMFLAAGQREEGFNTLDEMKSAIPDSGFIPDCYRMKIEYLLSDEEAGGAAAAAAALADDYAKTVASTGMPQGFALEAEFYKSLAEFSAGSLNPAGLQRNLDNLLVKVSGPNPILANRIRLQIGSAIRAQGRADEAKKAFERLVEGDAVDVDTRAGALLGLGHLAYERAGTNRDNFREALLSFLRVYIETREADDNVVAEALHFASESAKNWGGQDASFMSTKLRRILTLEYSHTSWGKPK